MSDPFDRIVFRVNKGYRPGPGQRVVRTEDGRVVHPTQGVFGWLFEGDAIAWVVDANPANDAAVAGVLAAVEVEFYEGGSAAFDVEYSKVTPVPGRAERVITALAVQGPLRAGFELQLARLVASVVASTPDASTSNWRGVVHTVHANLRRRVSDELGLDLKVELRPAGRRGSHRHQKIRRHFRLRDIETPQPFDVALATADDNARVALIESEDPLADELALALEAIESACAKRSLEDFHRRPEQVNIALRQRVLDALSPLCRIISELSVTPAAELYAPEQLPLGLRFRLSPLVHELSLELTLLLLRVDADAALGFELRATNPLDETIRSRARELTEVELAGASLDVVFEANGPHFESIKKKLTRWLERSTGYDVRHIELELLDAPPEAESTILISHDVALSPVLGPGVTLVIRASATLASRQRWLERGAPELERAWSRQLEELVLDRLHTLGGNENIESREALRALLDEQLQDLAHHDGYRAGALSLHLTTPLAAPLVSLHLPAQLSYRYCDPGGVISGLELSAELALSDEWAFLMRQRDESRSWEDIARELVSAQLLLATREEIRLRWASVAEGIRARFDTEASLRGYQVKSLEMVSPQLPLPATYERVEIAVAASLHDLDKVRWSGVMEFELVNHEQWFKAKEPKLADMASELATRALFDARRQHGENADTKPELIEKRFERQLHATLEGLGYRLIGLDGRLELRDRPNPLVFHEFDVSCRVGQRRVSISTSVEMRLVDAKRYRASGVTDIERWLEQATAAALRHTLHSRRFAEVLDDFIHERRRPAGGAERPSSVQHTAKQALTLQAAQIGYCVEQVLTIPDDEARGLLDGFHFNLTETYSTSWSGCELELELRVSGLMKDFSAPAVNEALTRGRPVKPMLADAARAELQKLALELSPDDFFFRWTAPQGDTRATLSASVLATLAPFGVEEATAQLTLHPPTYVQNVLDLRGTGPHEFHFVVPARLYHRRYAYFGMYKVDGLHEAGADQVYHRLDELSSERLGIVLGRHLATCLVGRNDQDFLTEDARPGDYSLLISMAADQTRCFCGEVFGLAVSLVNLTRQEVGVENLAATDDQILAEDAEARIIDLRTIRRKRSEQLVAAESDNQLLDERELLLRLGSEGSRHVGRVLGPPPNPEALVLGPPSSGYPCTELGCGLPLELRTQMPLAAGLSMSLLESLLRATVTKVLAQASPNEFWLYFDRPSDGQPALSERLTRALRDATVQLGLELEFELELPSSSHGHVLDVLCAGPDYPIELGEVTVDGGRELGRLRASFGVEGIAAGHWQRFERQWISERVDPADPELRAQLAAWATQWLKQAALDLRLDSLADGLHAVLSQPLTLAATKELGLELGRVRLSFDFGEEALAQLRARRTKLREELAKLPNDPIEAIRLRREFLQRELAEVERRFELVSHTQENTNE